MKCAICSKPIHFWQSYGGAKSFLIHIKCLPKWELMLKQEKRNWETGKPKLLDLGCGNHKLQGSFGIDCIKTEASDLQYNLDKTLPKKFWHKFDLVYSRCLIDHLGNPLNFILNCKRYAKPGGKIQIITDNADYWRYHKKGKPFGSYHATLWLNEKTDIKVQHKMMFQLEHMLNLFALAGITEIEHKFFWKALVDKLLPKRYGSAYISVIGKVI